MSIFEKVNLPWQVDCQQLAGDTCDVTGLAEFMVEVGEGLEVCHPKASLKKSILAYKAP